MLSVMIEPEKVILTPDMLTPQQAADMDAYRPLARPAARKLLEPHLALNSRMSLLGFDPENPAEFEHPFQDPEAYLVKSKLHPVELGNQSARMADGRYDDMVEMARGDQEAEEIIRECGEIIANGGFIWIVTAHIDDLTDIAYAGQLTTSLLNEVGGEAHTPKEKLMMLSMALSEGGYEMEVEGVDKPLVIPMVQVVQTGFNKVIRTWPKTDSSIKILEEFGLPDFAVDRWINGNAILATEQIVEGGHGIGAMGSSGTTRTRSGAMSPINSKTIDMLTLPNAYMLGMTLWRQSDKPVARFLGRPVKINPGDRGQVDNFFTELTADMNGHIAGGNFRYKRPASR